MAEKIIRGNLSNYIIARTMVLYGYFPGVRKNYITWLIEALQQGKELRIVTDQYGTPTLADDCAHALLTLYEKKAQGIYNTAGREVINRYDIARKVIDIFQFKDVSLSPISTDQLNQDAPRPLRSGLKIDKINNEFGIPFSSPEEGIIRVKEQMESENLGRPGK